MHIRTPLKIQGDVLFALFQQDLRARFSQYSFGNFWFLVEPLILITFFIILFGARGRGDFGQVEPPVFVMAGLVPFILLFQMNFRGIVTAPQAARRYLLFRQITVFDVLLVKGLSQLFLFFMAVSLFIIIFLWIGMKSLPAAPLEVICWAFVLWLYGFGFGMVIMYYNRLSPEIGSFIGLLAFPLKMLSAVFFPMTMIPEPARSILALNPLAHVNELIRENWFSQYISPIADPIYAISGVIILVFWGLCLYRLKWQASLVQK